MFCSDLCDVKLLCVVCGVSLGTSVTPNIFGVVFIGSVAHL